MTEVKQAIKKVLGEKKAEPLSNYKITYESVGAQLEPAYYWILDFLEDNNWNVEKITDNFVASPGSGQFEQLGLRAAKMREEASNWGAKINQVVRSILNLIYDLKEFKLRIENYDNANSDDRKKREAGILALKTIWLDNVDIKKGPGAIHNMVNRTGFSTLRDAFMEANSIEDVDRMHKEGEIINKRLRNILISRIDEFNRWRNLSEKELRKRMSIEKNYLRSQIESLKLYSKWLKPYIKAAEELEMKGFDKNAAIINASSTSLFQLTLLSRKEAKMPDKFRDKKVDRKYYSIIVVDVFFRGHVSQRVTQRGDIGFGLGGRLDLEFESYALNEDELKLVKEELDKEDFMESVKFSMGMAESALKDLEEDLKEFLTDEERGVEKKKEGEKVDDINPFSALFEAFKSIGRLFGSSKEKKEIRSVKDIRKDSFVEKSLRDEAEKQAKEFCYTIYDIYKKSHGMASADFEG